MEFNQENRSFCTPSAVLDTVAEQLADVDLGSKIGRAVQQEF